MQKHRTQTLFRLRVYRLRHLQQTHHYRSLAGKMPLRHILPPLDMSRNSGPAATSSSSSSSSSAAITTSSTPWLPHNSGMLSRGPTTSGLHHMGLGHADNSGGSGTGSSGSHRIPSVYAMSGLSGTQPAHLGTQHPHHHMVQDPFHPFLSAPSSSTSAGATFQDTHAAAQQQAIDLPYAASLPQQQQLLLHQRLRMLQPALDSQLLPGFDIRLPPVGSTAGQDTSHQQQQKQQQQQQQQQEQQHLLQHLLHQHQRLLQQQQQQQQEDRDTQQQGEGDVEQATAAAASVSREERDKAEDTREKQPEKQQPKQRQQPAGKQRQKQQQEQQSGDVPSSAAADKQQGKTSDGGGGGSDSGAAEHSTDDDGKTAAAAATAAAATAAAATTAAESAAKPPSLRRSAQRKKRVTPDKVERKCPAEGCSKTFDLVKRLKEHIKTEHANARELLETLKPAAKTHHCPFCAKAYAFKSGLFRHIREVHPHRADEVITPKHDARFPCFFCDTVPFKSVTSFIQHTREQHPAQFEDSIDYTVRYFPSMDAFSDWLRHEQDTTYTEYLLRYNHTTDSYQTWDNQRVKVVGRRYRVCARNRPAPSQTRNKRPRRKKLPKGVGMCLARMWIDIADDKRVRVRFLRNHSHKCTPEHTSIPKNLRDFIATQIAACIPPVKVLNNLRSAFAGTERAALITLQDINNIARTCVRAQLDHDDSQSLMQRLHDLAHHDPGAIVSLKAPGEPAFRTFPSVQGMPVTADFAAEDFVLVLQTAFQKQLMKECGSRGVFLAVTAQNNKYHYPTMTLVGESPAGNAVALAHCISNKKTASTTRLFFASTTVPLGVRPHTYLFMNEQTDAADFEIARETWGASVRPLLCTWAHGDIWQTEATARASTPHQGRKAFKALVHLLRAQNPQAFEASWDGFCRLWKPTEPDLVEWASEHMYEKRTLWARAFREPSDPSTENILSEYQAAVRETAVCDTAAASLEQQVESLFKLDTWQQNLANRVREEGDSVVLALKAAQAIREGKVISPLNIEQAGPALFKVKHDQSNTTVHTVTRQAVPTCMHCRVLPCIHVFDCTCFDFAVSNTGVCQHTGAVYSLMVERTDAGRKKRRAKQDKDTQAQSQQTGEGPQAPDTAATTAASDSASDGTPAHPPPPLMTPQPQGQPAQSPAVQGQHVPQPHSQAQTPTRSENDSGAGVGGDSGVQESQPQPGPQPLPQQQPTQAHKQQQERQQQQQSQSEKQGGEQATAASTAGAEGNTSGSDSGHSNEAIGAAGATVATSPQQPVNVVVDEAHASTETGTETGEPPAKRAHTTTE
ncbi:hypothetical protein PTSG_04039 [Salpingoeca rosetta]|uniref:C2H2-type domain-containing protein n=1 Tax=Salpingoeca rosetta (strain ATCC 50818 / BSB-021) TaxID=946362 RepID=F2U7L5_SALR5|nr:uncharacterized protein PTSG_04039 [Salpingoeca rosetta]EGD83432.1 hypothetical protein PTSG_04039 [Salpingoeca rosetta]|eukprot:XP_004994936.1 hypothetical protein PTSG_04039 [Salpingoeca rosetta]